MWTSLLLRKLAYEVAPKLVAPHKDLHTALLAYELINSCLEIPMLRAEYTIMLTDQSFPIWLKKEAQYFSLSHYRLVCTSDSDIIYSNILTAFSLQLLCVRGIFVDKLLLYATGSTRLLFL